MHREGAKDAKILAQALSFQVIGSAIEVHRQLGPGLLESVYRTCLCRELAAQSVPFQQDLPVPVRYRGLPVPVGYRADLMVGGLVIVELKAVSEVLPIHVAQLLTYLRLTDTRLGLLINFNVTVLRSGVRRVVNNF